VEKTQQLIAESWQRCRTLGLKQSEGYPSVVVTGKDLDRLLEDNVDLIDAARPLMQSLYELVSSSGFVVVLLNAAGYIIEVIGGMNDAQSTWTRYYACGVKWTEDLVGTSALSLALMGHGPIQVAGKEHYCQAYEGWTCSAAPLTDDHGKLMGVLSVTGSREDVHSHTLGMVVSAAAAISNTVKVRRAQKQLEDTANLHATVLNSVSDGLLMINGQGIVTFINPTGAKILNVKVSEAIGKHIQELVDFKPVVLRVLETGQGYTDKEFFIETKRGVLHFIKTAIPLRDKDGRLEGVVDIFREIKQVRKLVNRMVGATAMFTFDDIVGESACMVEIKRLAKIAANSMATVLIQGESGTGKEMVAQAIHKASARSEGPFVAINCGALPRDLVESELFGYEDGAFTGARQGGRPGKFELAHGGTIFLDEIGEMSLDVQVKILRVLQDKRILRVGGTRYMDVDVRVIAATNRDLLRAVGEGSFRQDLYYRLNVLPILVPPLRERRDDVERLAVYFMEKTCEQLGVPVKRLSPGALTVLRRQDWPGNARELENIIERAAHLCEGPEITEQHLPMNLAVQHGALHQENRSLRDIERVAIEETLLKTQWNVSRSARLLGVGRNTLYGKIREYQIEVKKELRSVFEQ
jgi:PAS domain S-box-containing protein